MPMLDKHKHTKVRQLRISLTHDITYFRTILLLSHLTALKVDVDQAQDVSSTCGVSAMPTFQFYKSGQKIGEVKGANPTELEATIKQHRSTGASTSSSKKNYGVSGHTDLTDHITPNQMDALNQKQEHNVKNIFKDDESYLESDVDEQLIISVPFNQRNCQTSFLEDQGQAPKTIKLFANRRNLGFDDADSVQETQTLELEPSDFDEDAVINLRFVKFQNVVNLVLFVESNQEDEETTQIQQLIFIGSSTETTNMGDLKNIGEDE
ncbi:Thioredoxin-like protein 1 [Apophysomyces ossiformis]|uniref:Thioredoxin-like protein 1 n=1 Tax=Apophysomyces ossiformis TaxID=679940 RepID=A0A8H7ESH1_9FUNG|nr:Thioredoxin-like protein 1 [Apophysomyces ossiformis]